MLCLHDTHALCGDCPSITFNILHLSAQLVDDIWVHVLCLTLQEEQSKEGSSAALLGQLAQALASQGNTDGAVDLARLQFKQVHGLWCLLRGGTAVLMFTYSLVGTKLDARVLPSSHR